ncbi:MAG: GntR family transcriptional regulator [Carbonactinosporaceae bacterium]
MAKAADRAYDSLRSGILTGEFVFGSRLGEAELAETFGVSRTPVREALRRLSSEGLVEVLPNRGARVAQWSEQDLHEIYELRALLESYGAARAATGIEAREIAMLTRLCDEMEAVAAPGPARDLERLATLNGQFHEVILRAAGNARLVGLMGAVVHVPLVLRTYHRYSDEALTRSLGHHRELLAALCAGDPLWAEAVMRSHVLAARAALVTAMRADRRERA